MHAKEPEGCVLESSEGSISGCPGVSVGDLFPNPSLRVKGNPLRVLLVELFRPGCKRTPSLGTLDGFLHCRFSSSVTRKTEGDVEGKAREIRNPRDTETLTVS